MNDVHGQCLLIIKLINHFNHFKHVVDITEDQVNAVYNSALNTTDPFAKELYFNLLKTFQQPLLVLKLLINSDLPISPLMMFQSVHDCLYLKKNEEIAKMIDAVVEKFGRVET